MLTLNNPVTSRVGADVFSGLPATPGVYFFHDVEGRLLYIGQSCNLRARVGSYRHVSPERHPRRILRLVHRIARIEWEACETAEAAVERERVLLLERRPPFNRAGVWQGPPWWMQVEAQGDLLEVRLLRNAAPDASLICHGPLPSGFRHVHAMLLRVIYRMVYPEASLAEYPPGLINLTAPLHLRLRLGKRAADLAAQLSDFARGEAAQFLNGMQVHFGETQGAAPGSSLAYWQEQCEGLRKYAAKVRRPVESITTAESSGAPTPVRGVQHLELW